MKFPACVTIPLLLFSCLNATSQTGKITGKIVNEDGLPVEFVNIQLLHTKQLVVSDQHGVFKFNRLPALADSIIISAVDSKPFIIFITLTEHGTLDIGVIKLFYKINELQNVEIRGRVQRSYKSDYSFAATKTETPLKDIPQSVSTITKELIKEKMDLTVKDAIGSVAGVNHYSGYDEYTIRGFRAENAGNINGLRGYNTTYTSAMLVNIERIEVIKGPVASLYGNGDPGGTINLVTKKPLDKKAFSIDVYGGSWDHFRIQTDLTTPINKSKTLLCRFNAGYDNTRSFIDQLYKRSYQLAPSLSFIPNKRFQANVDLSLSHVNTVLNRGQPGFLNDSTLTSTPLKLSVSQRGDFLEETDRAMIASASYKINGNLSFNVGFLNYVTKQKVADHGLKDYITDDSVNLYYTRWNYNTITNSVSNYFTYRFAAGKTRHKLLVGYDFIKSSINLQQSFFELPNQFGINSGIVGTFSLKNPSYSNRKINDYELSAEDNESAAVDGNVYYTHGLYVQDHISLNRWQFLLGLRREFYRGKSEDDDKIKQDIFTWRAGLLYKLKPTLSVYASYNTGFDPFEVSGTLQVFNAPLKPIRSSLIEAGAKSNFLKNKLAASLAVYRLTVNNIAVNANDIADPDLYVQQGQNRSTGMEAELNGDILPNLDISFSYAYCNATITRSNVPGEVGKQVENAAHHLSNSWINYTFNKGMLKGLGISLGHEQVSERATLQEGISLPGYFILNTSIRYRYRNICIDALLNNITDKLYWTAAYNTVSKWPGKPRNFMINIGYQL